MRRSKPNPDPEAGAGGTGWRVVHHHAGFQDQIEGVEDPRSRGEVELGTTGVCEVGTGTSYVTAACLPHSMAAVSIAPTLTEPVPKLSLHTY